MLWALKYGGPMLDMGPKISGGGGGLGLVWALKYGWPMVDVGPKISGGGAMVDVGTEIWRAYA